MKKIVKQALAVLLVTIACVSSVFGQGTLTGKVVDRDTQQPMVGVSIYLPDFKVGTTTNGDGVFRIHQVSSSKVLLQATFVGFRNVIEQVDLATPVPIVLFMEPAATEINEVVVTGNSKATEQKRTPAPVSVVSRRMLVEATSFNIIDALATQPGISQVTTGVGISKPTIRGLGYNRVLVVNDGVRQEGQQWGDEHGVEVDEFGVDRVEILKGPASLAYGSDAMAGVINLISAPLPTNGMVQGSVVGEYQTNNGLAGVSANVAGNAHSFVWDTRLSGKLAHSYQNRYDGYVYNSGFRENSVSTLLGVKRSWGYSNLTLSYYRLSPGIVEGERDGETGRFLKQVVVDGAAQTAVATDGDAKRYTPGTPSQQVNHYKAVLNTYVKVGESTLRSIVGFQQNQRKELADVLAPATPGLYFKLNTLSYDFQYLLPEHAGTSISVGVNGMGQESRNLGTEYLTPEYNLFDVGLFTIVRRSFGKLDLTGGLRVDSRRINSKSLYLDGNGMEASGLGVGAIERFAKFGTTFRGVSGSVGATYQLSRYAFLKANLSRGYRAPNIAELGSNGIHEGTIRYELGDANLKPESSLQADLGFGLSTEHISGEVSLFNNRISNFIYLHKLSNVAGADSTIGQVDAFKFASGNANLVGGEVRLDIHPHPYDWIHFENSFSYVLATLRNQPASSAHLPFTPAPKLVSGIKLEARKAGRYLADGFLRFDVEAYFRQGNTYSAYHTETSTQGYVLLNAGVGASWVSNGRVLATLQLGVNNLADIAYQSHLSRLKYAPENPVTGRMGIYNMGRNVCIKVMVPFGGGAGSR